ncbi:hypothetical protein WH367_24320, partial [Comamonas sp. MYb21]|uniref:hypothetical protein n=1 Tax=Comamonas sp. MYb21 TaxID=1848648 RepID=UPI0030AE0907
MSKYYYVFAAASAFFTIITVGGCGSARNELNSQAKVMAQEGRAYYENKCKTIAGEKIYRSVVDVEGIFLIKIRPFISENQLKDPMWPGAAFALEFYDDSYISSFLDYEYATKNIDGSINSITKDPRGYTKPEKRPGARPGYRFVDVVEAK